MSIAMLGWAMPALGAAEGSGYNLNAGELAAGLASRGHRVSFLRSGTAFSFKTHMRIGGLGVWRGVRCDEVFNSPIVAPAYFSFGRPSDECASPELVSLVLRWLDSVAADVVHVQSLEGFTHDVMGAILASGRRLVATLHNHWFICPQVDLFYRHAEPCIDYEGGRKCESCTRPPSFARTRLAASGRRLGERLFQVATVPKPDPVRFKAVIRRLTRTPPAPRPIPLEQPADYAGADDRLLAANAKLVVLNTFGERRRSALAAISSAHRVLVPSRWMRDVALAFGIPHEKVSHIPLGQPHFDALADHPRSRPPWRPDSGRPLDIVFLGSGDTHKGLQILADALLLPAPLERCRIRTRTAWLPREVESKLRSLGHVEIGGPYDVRDLPHIFDHADIVLYPQICYDNSPLVVMEAFHAGVPVIASDLGGPRSMIAAGVNGLLFPAGDPASLREALHRVTSGAWAVPDGQTVRLAACLPRFAHFVSAIEREYERNPVG